MQKVKEEYKNNKDDKLLQWIMFLLNPESEEVDNIMVKNKKIEEAKKELLSLSQDEENQRIADFRERDLRDKIDMYETGIDIGQTEGIKVGILKEKRRTVISLLKMNTPIEKIKEITQLTKDEIEKIKKDESL